MGLQLAGAPGGRKRAHGVDPSHRVGALAQVSFVPCGMVLTCPPENSPLEM